MKWYTIQRADGKYYSDQKELVKTIGPQWVPTASASSLFWGHKGEPIVKALRDEGVDCELVPVEVTVRARSKDKGKPHPKTEKPTRSLECAACGSGVVAAGRCQDCGSDMLKPSGS